jgi:acetyl esterase/lipase
MGPRFIAALVLVLASVPAEAQRVGTLISADPVAQAPAGMQAWRISYWTSDDNGAPLAVTGMVVAPSSPDQSPRKVLAWTHGTWGVVPACAPSLSARFFQVTPGLDAVSRGYVVVAPDYPGLGSPTPHPYLVGPITGRSVLDAIRAARQISAASAGNRFAVWGESQGGHAALWTGQLARTYAPDLRLVGVAAGVPPTELRANFQQASAKDAKAFLTGFTAYSWSRYYNVPLLIGRRKTPALITKMAQKCLTSDSTPSLGTVLGILALKGDLRHVDFATLSPWATFVTSNSVPIGSSVPVIIAQTRADPLVALAVTRQYARDLCAKRVAVRWIDLPGGDHAKTAKLSAPPTLQWIDDRFAGVTPPSDCGGI